MIPGRWLAWVRGCIAAGCVSGANLVLCLACMHHLSGNSGLPCGHALPRSSPNVKAGTPTVIVLLSNLEQ